MNYSKMSPGFNLVELMATVSIICIIMVLGGVYSNSSYYKLRNAAHSLSATIQKTRLEAIKRNRNVFLDFDADDDNIVDSGLTMWMDLNGDGSFDDASELVETIPGDAGISYGSVPNADGGPTKQSDGATNIPSNGISLTDNRAIFRSNGTVLNSGTIFIYSPEHASAGTYEIGFNSTGHCRMWYYQPGATSWKMR